MRKLALSKDTAVGGGQHWQFTDKSDEAHSVEINKNTLELKTARDVPALTYLSHVLEAVMLKAANERVKMLSRNRTTDISRSEKWPKRRVGKDRLLNATSLSNKKGRVINLGILVLAFIVGCITVAITRDPG